MVVQYKTHISIVPPGLFSLILTHSSALDNGVPVKVVLDVLSSKDASHLKVSHRQSVLLLAQLAVMTCVWRKNVSNSGLLMCQREIRLDEVDYILGVSCLVT